MHNAFISIVCAVNHRKEVELLPTYLSNVFNVLEAKFSDFEIVVVNNSPFEPEIAQAIKGLQEQLRKNIFLLNLSSTVNKNHAFFAGLDRANGDYTVIFEFDFLQKPDLIEALFLKTEDQFDIVYCRAKGRNVGHRGFLYRIFYYILKHYSDLDIDKNAHNTRIISRRALNSLLRLRENLRYMKAIYSIVGYKTTGIDVIEPLPKDTEGSFSDQFRTSLVAITSFTTFLRNLMLWILIFSLCFMVLVVWNAVKVKFTNYDLLGNYQEAISGWTFTVVLMSIFFAITCLNLYIISIYLANIYNEIKQRPLYIIESIKRF
jgi:Glycosyl transferase family 2